MLIQFSFENYLSFKDRMTFSLLASPLKEATINNKDAMHMAGEAVGPVLHCAAIFGANASGKSNVIKAMSSFRWMVINSMKNLQSGERLKIEGYRLDHASVGAPTMFEIVMCNQEHIFRYGFEADSSQIYREWLYQKANRKRAKEVELIYREKDTFAIHAKMSIIRDVVNKKMVRDNALLLSVAAQFNDPIAVSVTNMISEICILRSGDEPQMWAQTVAGIDDEAMRRRIVAFSKYADLGIDDIEKVNDKIISRHVQYGEDGEPVKNVSFVMEDNESEGTLKYFRLAYPLIHALDTGTTLVVDELDSQLHPVLTANIASMFNSAATNPHNAQLIMVLHDTNVLSKGMLRRDQIWFTQKSRKGESELYSLAEYNVRGNAPFEKDYLSGKYGAIPITGILDNVFTSNAE